MEINAIHQGDCLELMRRMGEDGTKVDLVLTSPPYNMTSRKGGTSDTGRYDVYEDWLSTDDYVEWTLRLFTAFDSVLRPNRAVLYNFSYSVENPSLPYRLVTAVEESTPFMLVDTIVWRKRGGLPFPANPRRLSRNWEFVWVFVRKDEADTYENNRKPTTVSDKTGQTYYDCVFNTVEAANNDGPCSLNQATFSTELCDSLLGIYAKDGWDVLDPFMGTGTTAVSCVRRGLGYIGSELSAAQIAFAEERIANERRRIASRGEIEQLF